MHMAGTTSYGLRLWNISDILLFRFPVVYQNNLSTESPVIVFLWHTFIIDQFTSQQRAEGDDKDRRKEIVVLDLKRSQTINIGLTKLPPVRTLKQAIINMDSTVIDREGVEVSAGERRGGGRGKWFVRFFLLCFCSCGNKKENKQIALGLTLQMNRVILEVNKACFNSTIIGKSYFIRSSYHRDIF